MKHIIKFFILFIYIFSFVIHNSVMAFSHDENLNHHKIINNWIIFNDFMESNSSNNVADCSLILNSDQDIQLNSDLIFKKIVYKIKFDFLNILIKQNIKIDKFYVKIKSPPYLYRDLKNYNYSKLIKIIKSNI